MKALFASAPHAYHFVENSGGRRLISFLLLRTTLSLYVCQCEDTRNSTYGAIEASHPFAPAIATPTHPGASRVSVAGCVPPVVFDHNVLHGNAAVLVPPVSVFVVFEVDHQHLRTFTKHSHRNKPYVDSSITYLTPYTTNLPRRGWGFVTWQRRCKTRRSLCELDNQATHFVSRSFFFSSL